MKLVLGFVLRWIITAFGLWLAIRLFGTGTAATDATSGLGVFMTAGFLLAIINIFIKPFVQLISLPLTILTLGLFTLVINGLMVYFALQLAPDISITFGRAIIAGIVIGIVNYGINATLDTIKVAK